MKLYDLIARIATVNKTTLEKYNIDLHKQRLVVKSLKHLEDGGEFDRNTEVVLYANTREVMGSQTYYYNRTIINDNLWPDDHTPRVSLEAINQTSLIQALIDLDDNLVNKDLLTEIKNNNETNLTLHYTTTNPVDKDAFVSINCVGYYGISNLIVEVDVNEPIRLDEVLVGGELDGFDQTIEP